MSQRKIKYQSNEVIEKCPLCKNNTEFTVRSEQVAEDCCEVWAVCKCGYDPTFNQTDYRVEDVMGGCDDDNCKMAVLHAWNDPIKESENY